MPRPSPTLTPWTYRLRAATSLVARCCISPLVGPQANSRIVATANALGVGSGTRLYYDRAMSPAPSTNSLFELWNGVSIRQLHGAIDDAITKAARRILDDKEDHSIILGDPMGHWGTFERWNAGTTTVPDGWNEDSGDGAVLRVTSPRYSGRYAMRIRNTASNAYVLETDDFPYFPQYAGQTITLHVKMYTTTSGRARVNFTDGVAVANSAFHNGEDGWDGETNETELTVELTLNDSPTELRAQIEITTGGQITVFAGKMWVTGHNWSYEFELPESVSPATADETAFAYVTEVWMEGEVDGVFDLFVPSEKWDINHETRPRRIVFNRQGMLPYMRGGRQLKIVGLRHPRLPAADSDPLEVDPEYVRLEAAKNIFLPKTDIQRSMWDRWKREADDLLDRAETRVPYGALVEA